MNENIEKKAVDIVFDENKLFKQSNRLIESHYKLTIVEQKIMFAIISQLGKNQDDFFICKINAGDLANFCKFKNTDKYTKIKNATMKLMQRVVKIRKANDEYYLSHWVQSMEYKNDGTIIYELDQKLKPELLQLKQAYLSEESKPLMQFSSQYACRFYLLFKQYLRISQRKFDIDNLISMFQLNKKTYGKISNLKSRVIEPAIKELNRESDLEIKYEYIKEKRKIVAINFTFKLKYKVEKNDNNDDDENKDSVIAALTHFGIKLKVAMKIKKDYDDEYILAVIDKAVAEDAIKAKSKIDGFIVAAIKDDYYHLLSKSAHDKEKEIAKKKRQEEIKSRKPVFEQDEIIENEKNKNATINNISSDIKNQLENLINKMKAK